MLNEVPVAEKLVDLTRPSSYESAVRRAALFSDKPNATYTRAPESPAFIPILTGSRERSLTLRSRLLRERRAVEIDVERADLANTRVSERSENVVERLIGNHTVTNVSGLASAVNRGNRGLRSRRNFPRELPPQISLPGPKRRHSRNDKKCTATILFDRAILQPGSRDTLGVDPGIASGTSRRPCLRAVIHGWNFLCARCRVDPKCLISSPYRTSCFPK